MAAVADGVSAKKWDGDGVPLADSNCAGIGTDEDKALRKKAAQTEEAWKGVGAKEGIMIWRIEQFKVVAWPEKRQGEFYSGDSYIVLHTVKDTESPKLHHHIHFWLGETTSTDEMGTAAYKTVELDDLMDGEPTQSREVQGAESSQFKALFKHIIYLEGGVESGFHHVGRVEAYEPKLFDVRKTNADGVRVKQTTCCRESLNQGDCFILDMGEKIYAWFGEEAPPGEKLACTEAAERIESTRDGHAKVTHDIDDDFWKELGGEGPIADASSRRETVPEPDVGEGVLYSIADSTGDMKVTEVGRGKLGYDMLDSTGVMMLDTSAEICLWVGSTASPGEKRNAMYTATQYLKTNDKSMKTPIHMYNEGEPIKNEHWTTIFGKKAPPKAVAKPAVPAPKPAAAAPAAAAPAAAAPAAAAPAAAAPAAAAPKAAAASGAAAGPCTLADLQDHAIWSAKGVDATAREQALSDAEFQEVFGKSKAEFNKEAAWKQKQQKQKHGLF